MRTKSNNILTKEEQLALDESTIIIKNNFNLKTNQIPDHLLMKWIIPLRNDYPNPSSRFEHLIFLLGYSAFRIRKNAVEWQEATVDLDIDIEEYESAYSYFQSLLHLEHMRRLSIINFEPISLFHFENIDITVELSIKADKKEQYEQYMKTWLNDSLWMSAYNN